MAHGLHVNHADLQRLSIDDLLCWKMEILVEAYIDKHEYSSVDEVFFDELFPEDNPDDFETIFDAIVERQREFGAVDYDAAMDEANAEYFQRTGIDRREGAQ